MEKPKTLQAAIKYFADEQVCIDTVASLRWSDGKPTCPACGHQEHYWLKTQRRWKCKECWKQFTVKLGTIFEDSPLSLDKWLIALWMLVNCRNGVSSYEIGRALGVSQKSGWFMLHRLRFALREKSIVKIGGEGSEVEVDETYIGGSTKYMHKSRINVIAQARSLSTRPNHTSKGRYGNKVGVFGIFDREQRRVRASVIPQMKRQVLQDKILSEVDRASKIYSDESTIYHRLSEKYIHETVNHLHEYVDGRVHTNGIENFWSLLKRSLNGTYVAVEPFHLERYVDEQAFRFNNRQTHGKKMNDGDRFQLALSQIGGKRLTFAEVTGKAGSQETF